MNTLTITEEEMPLSKDYSMEEPSIKLSEAKLHILNERIKEAKDSILKSNEEVMIRSKRAYWKNNNLRRVVILRNYSMYYHFIEETQTIEILSFWDNRNNPKKLNLNII